MATLATVLGGPQLLAQSAAPATTESKPTGPKVKCAVIGLGLWGREIVNTLGRVPQAEIAAVCDTYPASLRRGGNAAPDAQRTDDYKTILANKDIKAVVIATPTHQHKEITLAALQAGKHVYCEAPLAHTIEDAREIARAAKAAFRQNFQPGLQMRSDPQRHFLLPFIRSGALGHAVMARAQWHKKTSWRSASPNPEHEKEINWRLDKSLSPGLVGEIGVHQLDQASWFLDRQPLAANGYGSIDFWKDGRDVPDTIQAVIEFPGGLRMVYDATLVNSFDAEYEVYYGSDAAVMLRDSKAWMFKEVDSPLLGWEVYARKDTFYKETGIALAADATKQVAQQEKATESAPLAKAPLQSALEAFIHNSNEIGNAVNDFISVYGAADPAALADNLASVPKMPAATFLDGFNATVTALKTNEAVVSGQRIVFKPEWYELG